jgi:hypothetical protein
MNDGEKVGVVGVGLMGSEVARFKTLRDAQMVPKLPKGGTGKMLKSVPRKMYGK